MGLIEESLVRYTFNFFVRPLHDLKWGGDLHIAKTLALGLQHLGHTVHFVHNVALSPSSDYAFLFNTAYDLEPLHYALTLLGVPYITLPYHEDSASTFISQQFFEDVKMYASSHEELSIEELQTRYLQTPSLPSQLPMDHRCILERAHLNFPNSISEMKTIQRDAPQARCHLLPLSPGSVENLRPSDLFRTITGLTKGEYLIQIGRFQPRKNQLATLLATAQNPRPLVLIAPPTLHKEYELTCLRLLLRWRKGPTWIFSSDLPEVRKGPHRIVSSTPFRRFSTPLIQSAIADAGLHIHPSFQERPGLTYLESLYFGIPTLASTFTPIRDYFNINPLPDPSLLTLVEPTDLAGIANFSHRNKVSAPLDHHPVMTRTGKDMAQEVCQVLNGYPT